MFLVTVVLVVLLIFALALFPIGLRGRRIDDHPICRKCGFDLFGAPPGSVACPECGADVTRPRAIRTGNRVSRPGRRAGALAALFVALASVLMTGWVSVRGTNLTPYKPAWVVVREVGLPEATMRPALRELAARVRAGKLDDAQINDIVDRALAHQSERWQPWVPAWGEFVEAAHDAGRLDDDRWERYLRESVQFYIQVRPRVRRGDPIPVEVNVSKVRIGDEKRFLRSYSGPAPLAASGVPLARNTGAGTQTVLGSGAFVGSQVVVLKPDAAALAKIPDGEHLARADVAVTITDSNAPAGLPLHFVVRPEARFALLPADVPSVTKLTDPELAHKLRSSIHLDRLFVDGTPSTVFNPRSVKEIPVTLGFNVFLRADNREWAIGPVTIYRGAANVELDNAYLCHVSAFVPGLDATAVDVVLRSNPKASVESLYMTDVWEGDVVLKDVKVEYVRFGGRMTRTMQPTSGPAASVFRE